MAALAGPVGKAVEVSASLLGGAGGLSALRPSPAADLRSRACALGAAVASAASASTGWGRTHGRGGGRSLCSLRCRDDLSGGRRGRGQQRTGVGCRFEEGSPGGAPLGGGRREG